MESLNLLKLKQLEAIGWKRYEFVNEGAGLFTLSIGRIFTKTRFKAAFVPRDALFTATAPASGFGISEICSLQNYKQPCNPPDLPKLSRHLYSPKVFSKVNHLKNRGRNLSFFPLFDT